MPVSMPPPPLALRSASLGRSELGASESDVLILAALYDCSQLLSAAGSVAEGIDGVLRMLERHFGVLRSAVTLLDEATGEPYVEASRGFDAPERVVRLRPSDRMTGQVAQAGPESLVRVPIVLDRKPVGALSIDLPHRDGRDFDRITQFLHVVGALIALELRTQRPIDAERQWLREENTQLREELRQRYDFSHIIGTSRPMQEVFRQVAQVTGSAATVLIRGESGTGKELVAHAIHHHSPRRDGPFVKVNCAALPESLIESELFGHERGAFTGALSRRKGRFEVAHGGTIFLDEIGELSLATQAKLLRVLQEREFERVGGVAPLPVDVRVIVATNRELERAIGEGTFREDLYYRLNVFPIFMPALRERKPDILLLADHFLEKFATQHERPIKRITTPAIDMLMGYHWPGNVRELENVIERAVLVCDGEVIHARHLPPTLQTAEASGTAPVGSLTHQVEALERDLLADALKTAGGNRTRAARLLGVTPRILSYKLRKYRLGPTNLSDSPRIRTNLLGAGAWRGTGGIP